MRICVTTRAFKTHETFASACSIPQAENPAHGIPVHLRIISTGASVLLMLYVVSYLCLLLKTVILCMNIQSTMKNPIHIFFWSLSSAHPLHHPLASLLSRVTSVCTCSTSLTSMPLLLFHVSPISDGLSPTLSTAYGYQDQLPLFVSPYIHILTPVPSHLSVPFR